MRVFQGYLSGKMSASVTVLFAMLWLTELVSVNAGGGYGSQPTPHPTPYPYNQDHPTPYPTVKSYYDHPTLRPNKYPSPSKDDPDFTFPPIEIDVDVDVGDIDKCFSGDMTVQVKGKKKPVSMRDLVVGDLVMTGRDTYSRLYSFGHHNPSKHAEFVQIWTTTTGNNNPLEMTGEHLVFMQGARNPVKVDSLRIGDTLVVGDDTPGNTDAAVVTALHKVQKKGIYAPLTEEGTLIVNGILASSYISLQKQSREFIELMPDTPTPLSQQNYVHITLSPYRLMCKVSSSLGICNAYNEDGMSHYVAWGIDLTRWVLDMKSVVLKACLLSTILLLSFTCHLIEHIIQLFSDPALIITAAFLLLWAAVFALENIRLVIKPVKEKKA